MLFNSAEFLIFLPLVFVLYWFVFGADLKKQNLLLLLASFVFYGWWDWRFLLLLIFMACANFFLGLKIDASKPDLKNTWFISGLTINITVLCVFKYFNFFIDGFIDLVSNFGYELPRSSTRIILPIGISFYTFLSLSYLIDIYKGNIKANSNFSEVLLSLSFFPIILAGPIQRPAMLLPQICSRRNFNYKEMTNGLRQILWGLAKKVVLADTCAANADYIFNNYNTLEGGALLLGVIFFGFQIYGDFSGYSDIAIGVGRLLGFNLIRNFNFPYFARDIADFWRRWHISLTTWFRDYLFLPLSVSIAHKFPNKKVFFISTDLFIYINASLVTWFLTGLWHGANYTYIFWGLIHGIFLINFQSQKKFRKNLLGKLKISNNNAFLVIVETIFTLIIVFFSWIFFKAPTVGFAFSYINEMFSNGIFNLSIIDLRGRGISSTLIDGSIAIAAVTLFEWIQRKRDHGFEISHFPTVIRWGLYWIITFACLLYLGDEKTFIYFQF